MAKRQRTRPGQRSARGGRPGTRPAGARPAAARPAGPARPIGALTAAEEARAAELEAQILAEERAAEASRARARERKRSDVAAMGAAPGRSREGSLLAARAEEEYAYVVRDVRRIARVGGSLVGLLAILFILIDVIGVIRL
jgi:hypothetical protein